MDINITPHFSIPEKNIEWHFIRSSGPGGQNVNKVATAVQLRWDSKTALLSDDVRMRLRALAGQRMTNDGVIVISAQRFRTQERNRVDAMTRLTAMITEAMTPPIPRKKTKPTYGSKQRRLQSKQLRGQTKRLRGTISDEN